MGITAAQVKELREKTSAGMLDCKKALEETGGDMEQAIDFLRKKGLAAAAKKSGRITSEGLVQAYLDNDDTLGVLLEVNCETDFVARNPDFVQFVDDLTKHIATKNPQVVKAEDGEGALVDQPWISDESTTVSGFIGDLIGKIGENISPRRFERWEAGDNGILHSYIHMGGRLGVLLEVAATEGANREAVVGFAHMLSMHIAATNPVTVGREEVSQEMLDREREIYRTQILEEGKPENLVDKIVEGKMNKFYKENCVLEQEWVHESKTTVSQAMAAASKEAGGDITVRRFVRWELGEGLEKRSNDLLAEVAEQLKGK